jgi:hypothetical protein
VTNLPVFIRAAEDRIFKLVDLEVFRKNATSALTQNDPYLTVPTDYLASFSLSITNSSSKGVFASEGCELLTRVSSKRLIDRHPEILRFF